MAPKHSASPRPVKKVKLDDEGAASSSKPASKPSGKSQSKLTRTRSPPPKSAKIKNPVGLSQENDQSPQGERNGASNGNAASSSSSLPRSFKIVAGSYEKLLYGLEGSFSEEKISLKPIFMFPAHVSAVKAIATSPGGGRWLATGSSDEIIKIWDLRKLKELGGLMQHEGSITYLDFPTRSYLVSASEDGTICLFRTRDWVLLRTLKGHKGRVNNFAIHPSGKLALSVGKDRALRMWDLIRGKGSASTKLGKEGEVVRWSAEGTRFAVTSQSTIDIYTTDMALTCTLTHPSRVHDISFCKAVHDEEEFLLVGAEDKMVTAYSVIGGDETSLPVVAKFIGHTNRVKSLSTLKIALPNSDTEVSRSTTIVGSVSSDGKIKIFDLGSIPTKNSREDKIEISCVAEYDTNGSRLICCALADGEPTSTLASLNKKRKVDSEQSEDEEEKGEGEGEGGEEGDEEEFTGFGAV